MKFRPILFSTPMVQTILEGRKTMTRRIVKGLPDNASDDLVQIMVSGYHNTQGHVRCPYGHPGDVLWVRENWRVDGWNFEDGFAAFDYEAGGRETCEFPDDDKSLQWLLNYIEKLENKGVLKSIDDDFETRYIFTDKKHSFSPSIHLPKFGCRLFLKIKSIKAERLHDISEEDAINEGVLSSFNVLFLETRYKDYNPPFLYDWRYAKSSFVSLWKSINGPESWQANPWVWAIEFERIEKPENFI